MRIELIVPLRRAFDIIALVAESDLLFLTLPFREIDNARYLEPLFLLITIWPATNTAKSGLAAPEPGR